MRLSALSPLSALPALLASAALGLALTLVVGTDAIAGAADRPLPAAGPGAGGARNLKLAPALSFTDDSSSNFPIRGEGLGDGRIASDRPTIVFFGTAHCWNTNREAERLVALYNREKDAARFVVVDLDHPSAGQKPLIARLYHGSIPTLAFLDRSGRVTYDEAGESARQRGDDSRLVELLRKASAPGSSSSSSFPGESEKPARP